MHRKQVGLFTFALLPLITAAAVADSKVTVGSPAGAYVRNAQNEPSAAFDPRNPNIVVAGANELIDHAPCAGSRCNFTPDVGSAGIYFSFDGGNSWIQPEYTGLSARTGSVEVGPIGTLPNYYESGLVAAGDPSLAFGPRPGAQGFDWANGSRLYYAHLANNLSDSDTIKGNRAIALSYTDDPRAAAEGDATAWSDPIIVTRQNSAMGSDKDAVWADNATSSAHFGNVYVCDVARQKEGATEKRPERLMFMASTDGGETWSSQQVGQAADTWDVASGDVAASHFAAGRSGGRQGCAIRTDSAGVVYLFWVGYLDRRAVMYLARSGDGGAWFEQPRAIAALTECGQMDPVSGGPTFDGVAGTRGSSLPSVDIANGAPLGADATDTIVLSYCDASDGLNNETALVLLSTDGGETWTKPVNAAAADERPVYPAVGISPDGGDLYITYEAFFADWKYDTASPRIVQGVVRHADVSLGTLGAWTDLHRSASGDARGSSRQLNREFIYDYVTTLASRAGAIALWIDARNAESCPAVNAYRQSLLTENPLAAPAPGLVCPAEFGNLDIYSGAFGDPTP